MAATQGDILNWIEAGKEQGSTHMISVCDGFDYSDYPVFVHYTQDVNKIIRAYPHDMQTINEVIEIKS